MASIKQHSGKWRAQIFKRGQRLSKSFDTKAEATAWARDKESEIEREAAFDFGHKTVGDLFRKYAEEVSVHKKGVRWEEIRLSAMQNDPLAVVALNALNATHIKAWRDRRSRAVSDATINREWNLISAVFSVARDEWLMLKENPMMRVKRPAKTPPRDRIPTDDELERMQVALGYSPDIPPFSVGARVGAAMLFAVETGMRLGEICALREDDWEGRVCRVRGERVGAGKTAAAIRNVPLSEEAVRLLRQVQQAHGGELFSLTQMQVDSNFRKARIQAEIANFHFHDTRALAITRLARKLDILSLAKMIGHRNLAMLQVYYRESAEDIAKRL